MKAAPVQPQANRLMIGGLVFDARQLSDPQQASSFQDAMAEARAKFGHALCMCRLGHPLKLQVRLREGKYHLAVWPNEGAEHDSECIFFRDDLDESASANTTAQPSAAGGDSTAASNEPPAREMLRMGLGMSEPTDQKGAVLTHGTSRAPAPSAAPASRAVTLRSLANHLWEKASLCKWHPTWQRDWGRARHELIQAAQEISLNGYELDTHLYVPRPYREGMQEKINGEWDRFVSRLAGAAQVKQRPHLLIAPVRGFTISTATQQPIMRLRHMRHPIGLTQKCAEFLQSGCKMQMRQLETNAKVMEEAANAEPTAKAEARRAVEVMGIFAVETTGRGGVIAHAAWLFSVHPSSFIPAPNANAVVLIDHLIQGGYNFQRMTTEASPMQKTAPDWILRHVVGPDGKPAARVALDVIDRSSSAEYLQTRHTMARKMAEKGVPTWTWVPMNRRDAHQPPILPPPQDRTEFVTQAQLRAITTRADLDYTLGQSPKFSL